MNQWDIYSYDFPEGEHPAVILSPQEQCLNPDIQEVNVVFCSSARPLQRPLKNFEVALDQSDGLDWKTAARCHKIFLVPKHGLKHQRGAVSSLRQRVISRKIVEVFRLPL